MPLRPQRTRRTKVYDCNYDIGARYYKPVVDDLERKYSGRPASADAGGGAGLGSLRSALDEAESSLSASSLRRAAREASAEELEDAPAPRRRPISALLDDFDSIYENRGSREGGRSTARSAARATALAALEDGEEEGASSVSNRLRAARARAQAIEDEFTSSMSSSVSSRKVKTGLDYSEKVLDTVGLKNSDIARARQALADDSFSKRTLKVSTQQPEEGAFTKWTKLSDVDLGVGADDDFDSGAAAARARKKAKARLAEIESELGSDFAAGAAADRARKSRARLADLEAEMEAVADRSAARERRAAGLRALVAENEAAATESSSSSSVRVRKVVSSVQSEKKTVTF